MTARSVGAVWRAYDLQLTTYAALLGAFGLVMAYTQQRRGRRGASSRRHGLPARRSCGPALAIVVFLVATAFDYRWLKTLGVADLRSSTSACWC